MQMIDLHCYTLYMANKVWEADMKTGASVDRIVWTAAVYKQKYSIA